MRQLRVEELEDRRLLAITVDTLVDEADGSIVDGDISLRDAIALAPVGETIDFAVTGTIQMEDALGEMTIFKSLTIEGPGASQLTIDAGHGPNNVPGDGDGYRIFSVSGGNVAMNGLTLTGGDGDSSGGAIQSRGNLTIDSITMTENSASAGGGIAHLGTGGTITTVTNSTISLNSANDGGGIYHSGTGGITMNVTNSTISGNSAGDRGGGIFHVGTGGMMLSVTNSTISDNSASDGGGIFSSGADHTVTLTRSIIGNSPSGGDVFHFGFGIFTGSNNLIEDGSGGLANTISGDPLLGPLADNGGPTWTHALLPGSPAIDAGVSTLPTDQRGLPRPVDLTSIADGGGNASDLGAYEAQTKPVADFTGDFLVGGIDFLRWQQGFGATSGAAHTDGNSDDDGDVDHSDLAAWEASFGLPLTTLTVITLDDAGPGSLRAAITAANTLPGANEIDFAVTGTIAIDSQLPAISEELTVTGPGADLLSIDAQLGGDGLANGNGWRIFDVNDGTKSLIDVEISGLTLTGGDVAGDGGAILNRENLTLSTSIVTGNAAEDDGGGIFSYDGTIDVAHSTISSNSAYFGGGIFNNYSSSTTLSSSTVSGNSATINGGGIVNLGGTLTIASSTLNGNSADQSGGGVATFADSTNIVTSSTISGNSADFRGGGIYNFSGSTTVTSSTITNNSASIGSGIDNGGSANATLNNTIVSGNEANDLPGNLSGNAFSGNFNLLGTGATTGGANNVNTDFPLLGPLMDHGGPTLTHGLIPGSAAIDRGNSALATDQRGVPRTVDLPDVTTVAGSDGSDIGAFERQYSLSLNWDGGGDGTDAFDPLNWNEDRVPTSLDNVILTSSLGNQVVDLGGQTLQVNRIDSTAANNDDYTFTNGTLEIFLPGGNALLTRNGGAALTFDTDILFGAGSTHPRFNVEPTAPAIAVTGNVAPSPRRTDTVTLEITSRNDALLSSVTIRGNIADGAGGAVLSLTAGYGPDSFNHTGVVTVTGDNTFTGQTLVNGATLVFDSIADVGAGSSALGAPTSVASGTIQLGAVDVTGQGTPVQGKLRYTGAGDTTDRVIELAADGSGGVIESNGTGALIFDAPALSVGAGAKTLTLGGSNTDANEIQSVIPDPAAPIPGYSPGAPLSELEVVKIGGGTWILSASNTYSGNTTVSDGTLLVNNTGGFGTGFGNQIVHSGATLGGSGSVVAVTVEDGGRLSPGASAGTLSVDDTLTFIGANSELFIEIGGTVQGDEYDYLYVESDTTTLSGQLVVDLVEYVPDNADSFTFLLTETVDGSFANVPFGQRVTILGGEGSFLVTMDDTDQGEVVLLSDYQPTALVAFPAARELIDAALAYGLTSDLHSDDSPQVFEPFRLAEAAVDTALSRDPIHPVDLAATEIDITPTSSGDKDSAADPWLAEELLERVFG